MDEKVINNPFEEDINANEMSDEALRQQYYAHFEGMAPTDILHEIKNSDIPDNVAKVYREILFNDSMFELYFGYFRYGKKGKILPDAETRELISTLGLEVAPRYTKMLLAGDDGDLNQCVACAEDVLYVGDCSDRHLTELDFYKSIVELVKDALPGFYRSLGEKIIGRPMDPVVAKLCDILDDYYAMTKSDIQVSLLEPALAEYPESIVINALLGDAYYFEKKWDKAIACLTASAPEGSLPILHPVDFEFDLGYSYSKLKEVQKSIEHYKNCVDLFPEFAMAQNNLGYEQHLAKDFEGAYDSFKKCLELEPSNTYAANNIVRTMIKLGRLDELKQYIDNPPRKLRKDIIAEAEKALSGKVDDTPMAPTEEEEPLREEQKESSSFSGGSFSTSGWTVE